MISGSQNKTNSKTVRNMLTWSYFRTRLMNKTREYPNCRVIALKSRLAKLAVNDFFTARLETHRSSNVHNVTKNLIETLMQLGIFY
jgi:hypothetical protein